MIPIQLAEQYCKISALVGSREVSAAVQRCRWLLQIGVGSLDW